MQPCDREGSFRAKITEYGLKQFDTGSVAVALKATLTEWWDGNAWVPWEEYQMEIEGDRCIVKKDGSLMQASVESLIQHAGWDGSIKSITNQTWEPTRCQLTSDRDEYKGKVRYRIGFVNDWGKTPGGGMNNVAPEKVAELEAKFGSQLRALAGNAKRNGAAPSGRPSAPPPPPPRVPAMASQDNDPLDTPF